MSTRDELARKCVDNEYRMATPANGADIERIYKMVWDACAAERDAEIAEYSATMETLDDVLCQWRDKAMKYQQALERIAEFHGMTNLGDCCVDKTCTPAFHMGEHVGHCQFSYGVNRGFNECAAIAREALHTGGKE